MQWGTYPVLSKHSHCIVIDSQYILNRIVRTCDAARPSLSLSLYMHTVPTLRHRNICRYTCFALLLLYSDAASMCSVYSILIGRHMNLYEPHITEKFEVDIGKGNTSKMQRKFDDIIYIWRVYVMPALSTSPSSVFENRKVGIASLHQAFSFKIPKYSMQRHYSTCILLLYRAIHLCYCNVLLDTLEFLHNNIFFQDSLLKIHFQFTIGEKG